jgi:hypothetical protein
MILTINKGNHYDNTTEGLWLFKAPSLVRYVRFHRSCIYELAPEDQRDVNKLYGLSYGVSEANSPRFGWWWDPSVEKFHLPAYVHDQGKLNRDSQGEFPIVTSVGFYPGNEWSQVARLEIVTSTVDYLFKSEVNGEYNRETVDHSKLNTYIGINRGVYFGGNNPAPHDMKLEISNKPL